MRGNTGMKDPVSQAPVLGRVDRVLSKSGLNVPPII